MISNKTKKVIIILVMILSFFMGYSIGYNRFVPNIINGNNYSLSQTGVIKTDDSLNNSLLNETYRLISKYFYSFDTVKNKEVSYGMIKGMVTVLKDKHTEFFTPDEAKKFNEVLNGDFEGIGAIIQKHALGVQVERIIAGSPAKDVGIQAKDVIIKADGQDLKDLELTDAVNKIKGPAGTQVKLEVLRQGEKETLTFDITRRKVEVPTVEYKIVENNVGYIALNIFGENSADEFNKAVEDLYSKNVKGIMIDLRDNSGGILDKAVEILSNFIEKDKLLVTTKEKNILNNKSYFSYGNNHKKVPLIVLINGNSASASEIMAGALKDYSQAILVGEKTYGKGSVQRPFTLTDGSEIKITVAKWYTPKDNLIDGIGIQPDIEVKFQKEDFDKKYDRQLEEGKKILNKFIETQDINKTIEIFNKNISNSGSGTTNTGATNSGTTK
ncbi:MAG: S41 family peptidase [Candidatus Gracilibacteria bacterium]|nr:S41 family peptidase [Candidatus Gracilibacteria bacterium]MDD3119905.1 S41 family peptidase [Candidatus Gracilibacteria bacterium]MDD4530076.1 S41 family peptidase [Candidatus Gracilibacteria bacterium]